MFKDKKLRGELLKKKILAKRERNAAEKKVVEIKEMAKRGLEINQNAL